MRAEITKKENVTIVSLEGQISFDTIGLFRDQCIQKLKGERVIFDLSQLNFVGSTGITSFFEVFKDVIESKILDIKFCNVKTEFYRLFRAWFSNNVEIYEEKDQAFNAFLNPALSSEYGPRTKISVPNFRLEDDDWKEDSDS